MVKGAHDGGGEQAFCEMVECFVLYLRGDKPTRIRVEETDGR